MTKIETGSGIETTQGMAPGVPSSAATLWLSGLPGSGKTTLGNIIHKKLKEQNIASVKLDGDTIRRGLSSDITSVSTPTTNPSDDENLRRVTEVCLLLGRSDCVAICSFVSPFKIWRQKVRERHREAGIRYFEVFLDVPLEECIKREIERSHQNQTDSLYLKAKDGEIKNMIGINGPKYERADENVDLLITPEDIKTGPERTAEIILEKFMDFLQN